MHGLAAACLFGRTAHGISGGISGGADVCRDGGITCMRLGPPCPCGRQSPLPPCIAPVCLCSDNKRKLWAAFMRKELGLSQAAVARVRDRCT